MGPSSELHQKQRQQQLALGASNRFSAGRAPGAQLRPEPAGLGYLQATDERADKFITTTPETTRPDVPGTTIKRDGHARGLWARVGAKRENSRDPSLSPASTDHEENDDEEEGDDDDEDGDDRDRDRDCSRGADSSAPGASSAGAKPHVGPMGIFLKVWSLVKVTKARHNKMKRLHSEDAGLPHHFIGAPGDQRLHPANGTLPASPNSHSASPASSSGSPLSAGNQLSTSFQHHHARPAQPTHILQDGLFRRAGSQPPLSSTSSYRAADRRQQQQQQQQGQLKISSTRDPPNHNNYTRQASSENSNTHANLQANGFVASSTNGSSSGVSSTASSTLATNSQPNTSGDQVAESSSQLRQGIARQRPTSWAARMKRSPTRAEQQTQVGSNRAEQNSAQIQPAQSMSYVSRYRFRRADANQRQVRHAPGEEVASTDGGLATPPAGALKPKLSQVLHLRESARLARRSESMSDDELQADAQHESEPDDGDDSDLNDIYSTPNDSIQSVPSGSQEPTQISAAAAVGHHQGRAPNGHSAQKYQMTKSFSSNNFSSFHSSKQQQQQQRDLLNSRKSPAAAARDDAFPLNGSEPAGRQQVNRNTAGPAAGTRGSTGSRFFISSSSSEDSSAPQQQQQQNQDFHAPPSRIEPLQLSVGLHYHSPVRRPNSLLISTPTLAAIQEPLARHPPTGSLLTPSALIMSGHDIEPSASVAAMSPMLSGAPASSQHDAFAIQQQRPGCQLLGPSVQYKRSPSLFEMSASSASSGNGPRTSSNLVERFSSKYPWARPRAQQQQQQQPHQQMTSFVGGRAQLAARLGEHAGVQVHQSSGACRPLVCVPHSISLHDCKLIAGIPATSLADADREGQSEVCIELDMKKSEYKLAQMLLELGKTKSRTGGACATARDERGYTALMHAIISENLSAVKCLIEHGVDLNERNNEGLSALDLVCRKPALESQQRPSVALEMMKLLIESGVDLDQVRRGDGSRLLDRLIGEHEDSSGAGDKLAFIDCLLHNGAKLGSATWAAASGKEEIQVRLLRKLCQDGYFLYKKSCIEAAVYRFEYALKRIASLEQQLDDKEQLVARSRAHNRGLARTPPVQQQQQSHDALASTVAHNRAVVHQIKYQTFLGLSRCERKRRFFKRALEFAHMSILVDSTAYEGYYSKAHILKDLGELDDALLSIDQTQRLVLRSTELIRGELGDLKEQQEEAIVFDGAFQVRDPRKSRWLEASRSGLNNTLDYLMEARKHITRLREEILAEKNKQRASN